MTWDFETALGETVASKKTLFPEEEGKIIYVTQTHFLQNRFNNLAINPIFPLKEGWLHIEGFYLHELKNDRSYLTPVDLKDLASKLKQDHPAQDKAS